PCRGQPSDAHRQGRPGARGSGAPRLRGDPGGHPRRRGGGLARVNVVVCAKAVPLASVTIQIDPATKRIIRTGVSQELDPQAAKAVEEALRLADRHGGSVTLVVMGRDDATVGIRSALAMGATAAVHLSDPALAGSDALGTSKALAAAIRKTPFDLVLCATESSDSYTGLVPGQLAQLLGIPPLTFATALTVGRPPARPPGRTIKDEGDGGKQIAEFLAGLKLV